jgi:hypothetical protein
LPSEQSPPSTRDKRRGLAGRVRCDTHEQESAKHAGPKGSDALRPGSKQGPTAPTPRHDLNPSVCRHACVAWARVGTWCHWRSSAQGCEWPASLCSERALPAWCLGLSTEDGADGAELAAGENDMDTLGGCMDNQRPPHVALHTHGRRRGSMEHAREHSPDND